MVTLPAGCSPTPYDFPTPESSSRSSATDDFCYVFVVELERGALGLGMGLIDGLVSAQQRLCQELWGHVWHETLNYQSCAWS